MISTDELHERVGTEPNVQFEVSRATDTETVRADPKQVIYGTYRAPFTTTIGIILEYGTQRHDLPPWGQVRRMALHGDEIAEFRNINYKETVRTGPMKTVHMTAIDYDFKTDG